MTIRKVPTVAFPVGNIVFPTHITHTKTPYCHHTANQWLTPFACFGLTHAPIQPQGLDRKNIIVGKYRGKAATAFNGRFCASGLYLAWTIPSEYKVLYFRGQVLWKAHLLQSRWDVT